MEDFICSFNISSIPGDLFCFKVLTALSISSSDISLFSVSFTHLLVQKYSFLSYIRMRLLPLC